MEKLYRILYPMRVVLVTSRHGSKENVISVAWCFPLSSNPPLFGICIEKKRFSYDLIHASREFAINIPGEELKDAVFICGRTSGKESDKFKLAKLTKEKGMLGAPLIKECLASIECEVVEEKEIGDHVLFVGNAKNVIKRKEGRGLYHSGEDEIKVV